jgi:aspartate 1-decarboxylase
MANAEALAHEPKLVFVDDKNRMLPTRKEVAGQGNLKSVTW